MGKQICCARREWPRAEFLRLRETQAGGEWFRWLVNGGKKFLPPKKFLRWREMQAAGECLSDSRVRVGCYEGDE